LRIRQPLFNSFGPGFEKITQGLAQVPSQASEENSEIQPFPNRRQGTFAVSFRFMPLPGDSLL
jgi:hypothetical protein